MAYTSIRGIPDPTFGVAEATPSQPPEWPGSVATGYYYVDNTTGTDSSNPNGTPNAPRATIPATLAAGSVVYIRGGPYAADAVVCSGTEADPVFITGDPDTRTVFNGIFDLQGTRAILERIHVTSSSGQNYRIRVGRQTDADSFLVVRDCEVSGTVPTGSGITLLGPSDSVVWNCHIHDLENGGGEVHGISFGSSPAQAQRIWIIDNTIERMGADCIQFQHGGVSGSSPHLVYIGRNTLTPFNPSNTTAENGIDLKACGTVIVSENVISGTRDSANGNGEAIRVNDEGDKDGPIWIIFNRIDDCFTGIDPNRNAISGWPNGCYIVGNIISGIDNITIGNDATHVVGNTLYDCATGITQATGECRNNLLHTIAAAAAIADASNCSNNLVFNSGTSTGCTSGQTGDPLLVNPASANFNLSSGSPAIGNGHSTPSVYATFQTDFSLSIDYDYAGNAWANDIGALVFVTAVQGGRPTMRRRLRRVA